MKKYGNRIVVINRPVFTDVKIGDKGRTVADAGAYGTLCEMDNGTFEKLLYRRDFQVIKEEKPCSYCKPNATEILAETWGGVGICFKVPVNYCPNCGRRLK